MSLTPALFQSAKPDGTDTSKLRPSNWNRVVTLINSLLDGADAAGSLLLRDPTDVTDGAAWLPGVAVGSVLVSGGVAAAPAWSAAPLLTSLQIADAGQPNQVITAAAAGVMSFQTSGGERMRLDSSGHIFLPSSGQIAWTTGAPSGTVDTLLVRDAASVLALRSGTSAQSFYLYNTFTDASNYRRLKISTAGGNVDITPDWAGTGTAWNMRLGNTWTIAGATGHLTTTADNTNDIGAAGASRPRNLFLGGSVTANGANLGYLVTAATTSAGPRLTGVWLPRIADLSANILYDYQDEYAFIDGRGATVSVSPASTSGATTDLFHDDSASLNWATGLTGGQVQITIDHSATAAIVPNRNNGSYQIGLTFRSDFVGPGHIKIEAWTTAAGGSFSTVYDADVTIFGGAFGCWVSPTFVSPDASFNMYKTRLTLSQLPDPTTGNFRVQRVQLYHATCPWDPFHLSVGGGTLYGALSFAGTAGGDTTLTRSAAGKLSLSGTTPVLQLGGTSASFPSLKRDTVFVQLRLADDSGVCGAATASLPAAAAARDGIIGFDTTLNALVYYVGGSRFKLAGTSF